MRDERLDVVRGLAIVAITVNHISGLFLHLDDLPFYIPSLTDLGYSSAAEIFVALSGYMVGLVYVGRPGAGGVVLQRAWKLYLINLFVYGCSAIVVAAAPVGLHEASRFIYLFEAEGLKPLIRPLILFAPPAFLDVLPLYSVLLALAVPMMMLLVKAPGVFAAVSLTVYVAAQMVTLGGAQVFPFHRFDWHFNVFAWQALFFLGMALGHRRLHGRAFDWFAARPRRAYATFAAFAAAAVVTRLEVAGLMPALPLTDKGNLQPLRLVHNALVFATVLAALSFVPRGARLDWLRPVALLGRQSLDAFAASIVLTYTAAALWLHADGGVPGYLISCVIVTLAVFAVAVARSGVPLRDALPSAIAVDAGAALMRQPFARRLDGRRLGFGHPAPRSPRVEMATRDQARTSP
ncbi:OpgC domain-containing protein [Chthonobacter rhizosphaerae]|uniref:OpgC domain-containing protein n=1 Tax=Chthonobacter rhizosphaerae TaxID=2735553 RepID=UPI0015EFD6A2|nr:OpgC domain-containing protein [Chthonobacter rhizosphaerae]